MMRPTTLVIPADAFLFSYLSTAAAMTERSQSHVVIATAPNGAQLLYSIPAGDVPASHAVLESTGRGGWSVVAWCVAEAHAAALARLASHRIMVPATPLDPRKEMTPQREYGVSDPMRAKLQNQKFRRKKYLAAAYDRLEAAKATGSAEHIEQALARLDELKADLDRIEVALAERAIT
jgi:hypothetical protein